MMNMCVICLFLPTVNGRTDSLSVQSAHLQCVCSLLVSFASLIVLVVWVKSLILIVPKWSELEITTGDIFRYTVNSLRASNSRITNEKETKHLDTLLRASTAREVRLADSLRYGSWQEIETARRKHIGDLQTAFLTVIDVSMRWSDVDIFLRFAHACKVKSYDGVIVDSATLVAIYEAIPASWCKLKDL